MDSNQLTTFLDKHLAAHPNTIRLANLTTRVEFLEKQNIMYKDLIDKQKLKIDQLELKNTGLNNDLANKEFWSNSTKKSNTNAENELPMLILNSVSREIKMKKDKESNVILFGLSENGIDDKQEIAKILNKLNFSPKNLVSYQRLHTTTNNGKPSPIILRLKSPEHKLDLINSSKRTKMAHMGNQIFINQDLTFAERF
jgi:hypothetical protein